MNLDPAFERLKRAVIERTGHAYYADKDKLLYDRARERMAARGIPTLEAYVQHLEAAGEVEWRNLEDIITVGETYFFRYSDHFDALRTDILPRLIGARAATRALRIWSIGCSNGSEPYSIAILLRELLGEACDSWRISLTGGDISEKALAQARSGRFSAWALRTMGPEDRERYFDTDGSLFVLKPIYRSMVRFERQNILDLQSPTPPLAWNDFDLILCRNVLIYFSPAQAIDLADALRGRLASDGVLLLGHAEATLAADPVLAILPADISRVGQAARASPQPGFAAPMFTYVPLQLPDVPLAPARTPERASVVNTPSAPADETLSLLLDLANSGEYEKALGLCRDLIDRTPLSARLHYYDALLKQVCDDVNAAEAALRRALYLDPGFLLARHRLAVLLLSTGRLELGRRALVATLRQAQAAPADSELAEGGGLKAGDIAQTLREQLASMGAAA